MKTPNIFKNSINEAEEHAAYMVAMFWLKGTTRILQREDGSRPAKLSDCAERLARDEMDREIYGRLASKMSSWIIARKSIQIALGKLYAGEYPMVKAHFTVKSDDQGHKLFCVGYTEELEGKRDRQNAALVIRRERQV